MKNLILLFSVISVIIFSGCAQKEVVIQTEYIEKECPKFPIEEFSDIGEYTIKNMELKNISGNQYILIPKSDFLDFVREYKENKGSYNLLRNNVIQFNERK